MEFMSWSLNAPNSAKFNRYISKNANGEWEVIDENGMETWSDVEIDFFHMYNKYHEKISAFGLHEFGVNDDGTIYDYRATSSLVVRNGQPRITMPTSLQYLMEKYPNIDYSLQPICFGQKVDRFLHINRESSFPTFTDELRKIAELYRANWPQVNTIEIDFEKVYTLNDGDPIYDNRDDPDRIIIGHARGNDWDVYRDFIVRVKNEVCIPLGMKLRVNMYAMTGDFNPAYYGWHDYKTLASGRDINGNQAIDEFQIMSYDFTYAYSAPGPSTPIWWLEDILKHVNDSLPPEKTWIGNAGYGRRWGLDNEQAGNAVTYKQLLMWQNGMYVHNHREGNEWLWHNQQWIPFAGFNDRNSGYQITYPHLYDKFDITQSKTVKGTVNRTTFGGENIVTSYFKRQQPDFLNVKAVVNKVDTSGNISRLYSGNGLTINEEYLGDEYTFNAAYRANRARYQYDKNLDACVPIPDSSGESGKLTFNFNVSNPGKYKLIAIIHFNTFKNNQINASLNGNEIIIGGNNLEDWFPFYVDKHAYLEVGEFDFSSSNSIEIGVSTGYIWGFIICEDFKQNFLGGTVEFNSNIQPYYKRDSNGRPTKGSIPEKMVLTGEILRRPPRPSIIFEDNFSHMLNNPNGGVGTDFADESYYLRAQDFWDSGPNKVFYEKEDAYACTSNDGIYKVGFTNGKWELLSNGSVRSSASSSSSNQLVLYKKFKANIQAMTTFKVNGTYPKAGVRLLATEEGNANEGYLAILDYGKNQVRLLYEDGNGNQEELDYAWMSDQLIGLKGSNVTLRASILNGKAYVQVGDRMYINGFTLNNPPTSGYYGTYISGGTFESILFNISTLDRFEPLEKLEVEIDNNKYLFGEVERFHNGNKIQYDDYGYLIYTGLDTVDTETNISWGEDYKNSPLAKHNSWIGNKKIRVKLVDAGIWFRNFYVGDAEGFSVAYNNDIIGFIETLDKLFQYNCKGIAMWTIGQEDPLIFSYIT